jgi:hypothetical protein
MCTPVNIVALGPFRVDSCSCGCLHLHFGPVTIRVDRSSLPILAELFQMGAERLRSPVLWRGSGALDNDPLAN